ncbi:MAG: PAS domain S-box-containing protein [Desulforhopalus sp.]|jgi:PAS domain S-box-containing protein
MKKEMTFLPAMIGELLEVIDNALLVIDSNHQIIFANNRTAKMFGTSPEALFGMPFSALFMPDDVDILVHNILSMTHTNREFETEAMFIKKDRNTFLGRISSTCFEWSDNQEGMFFSIHDISDMKAIEKTLKHSERTVFLGNLVDEISHQIRNPIVAIGGFTKRLQAKHGASNEMRVILNEVSRLERLLNTMNRFTRLPRPNTQKTKLEDLVQEIDVVVGTKVQMFGCTWSSSCDAQLLEENLLLDTKLFLEAIIDVTTNSCESYSTISTETERLVQCEISPSEDKIYPVILRISDFGGGIADPTTEHVFSHFYTEKTGHIGMGLTFARRIVEEQGGKITIQSKPGVGTTVNFHLFKERRRDLRTMRIS